MSLVPGEGAVQELAAASPDPAFGNRIHPGCLEHGPDPGVGETASNAVAKFDPRSRIMNLT